MRWVQLSLLCLAIAIVQVLIGGTRLLFSLPSCAILATMGLLSLASWRRHHHPANALCLITSGLLAGIILLRAWFSPVEYLARSDAILLLGAWMVYLLSALVI